MADFLFKFLLLFFLAAQPVVAQTLVPATSEDLQDFDRRVSEQLKKSGGDDNFGAQVREEAKKLNEPGADKGKEFGKWVSKEKKKAETGRPSTAGSGVGNGGGAGRAQAPGQNKDKGKKK